MIEEQVHTSDDTEFTQREMKQTIESFKGKMGSQVGSFYEHLIHSPEE